MSLACSHDHGGFMAKLRPGIEYPIIPEDFIVDGKPLPLSPELVCFDAMPCCPDGIVLEDWSIIENIMHQYSEA
jgi:hypothetical protein